MIALIRRLRSSAREVRASDWLLVGIEGLLVFLGILAAFQLQEWAEDRREAKQVERLMGRLLDETRQAVVHYDYHARETGGRLDRAKANLALFSQGRCPADFTDIEEVERLPADAPPDSALIELIDVVGLSALPDEELKKNLTGYSYATNVFYNEALPALQEGRSPLFPDEDPRARRDVDAGALEGDHSFATQMFATPSILSRRYDREALCADAAFKNRYASATQSLLEASALRNDLLLLTMRTCQSLASQFSQSCVVDWMAEAMGQPRIDAIEERLEVFDSARDSSDPQD